MPETPEAHALSLTILNDPRFSVRNPDVNSWVPVWREAIESHGIEVAKEAWAIANELAYEYGI